MNPKFALTVLAILVSSGTTGAQTWTTPDGFLSVTQPDTEKFIAVDSPPEPFVGLWVSKDEATKLGVMKTVIPTNVRLIQSSVEKGLAEEFGGEVTRLSTRRVAGHELWRMKAKGAAAEMTQAIVRHDNTVYKLMAVTIGQEPDGQTIPQFMDSLSLAQPKQTVSPSTNQKPPEPVLPPTTGLDFHNLSKSIGGLAALLGIGLFIYFRIRKK